MHIIGPYTPKNITAVTVLCTLKDLISLLAFFRHIFMFLASLNLQITHNKASCQLYNETFFTEDILDDKAISQAFYDRGTERE